MALEKTFVMIKPDGIQRGLIGEIISRIEKKGLKLVAMKFMMISKELAEKHYDIHKDKSFYNDLIDFITSSPVLASVWEGENAISIVRKLVGHTKPEDSKPGSIRGDFAISATKNLIHASDGSDTAEREISLFFNESELVDYKLSISKWYE